MLLFALRLPLVLFCLFFLFFFSSRRRHTRCLSDWSSDVCSSDLIRSKEPRRLSKSALVGTSRKSLSYVLCIVNRVHSKLSEQSSSNSSKRFRSISSRVQPLSVLGGLPDEHQSCLHGLTTVDQFLHLVLEDWMVLVDASPTHEPIPPSSLLVRRQMIKHQRVLRKSSNSSLQVIHLPEHLPSNRSHSLLSTEHLLNQCTTLLNQLSSLFTLKSSNTSASGLQSEPRIRRLQRLKHLSKYCSHSI